MLLNTGYLKMDFRGIVKKNYNDHSTKFSLGSIAAAVKTSENSCKLWVLVPLILDIPFTSKFLISLALSLAGYFKKI